MNGIQPLSGGLNHMNTDGDSKQFNSLGDINLFLCHGIRSTGLQHSNEDLSPSMTTGCSSPGAAQLKEHFCCCSLPEAGDMNTGCTSGCTSKTPKHHFALSGFLAASLSNHSWVTKASEEQCIGHNQHTNYCLSHTWCAQEDKANI